MSEVPPNVRLGPDTVVRGEEAFKRFRSRLDPAMVVGAHCTIDGSQFALGEEARLEIGDYCYLSCAVIACELEVRIGSYVVIGWNATIVDTDFHPISPALRIADALACSPLGKGMARPRVERLSVVIEDGVWIGPSASVLKGVRIGEGAWIDPGTMVTRDVPPGARVRGNPGRVVRRT